MRFVSLLTIPVLTSACALAACGDSSSGNPGDLGDGSTDASVHEASTGDDASADGGPETVCSADAAAGFCCCGNAGQAQPLCSATGELSCPAGYGGLSDRASCHTEHACESPDSGSPPDAGDGGDAGPAPDAGDAGDAGP